MLIHYEFVQYPQYYRQPPSNLCATRKIIGTEGETSHNYHLQSSGICQSNDQNGHRWKRVCSFETYRSIQRRYVFLNLFKLVKIGLNLSKLVVLTCQNLTIFKQKQTCPNFSKLVQTCSNLSKLVQNGLDLSKFV